MTTYAQRKKGWITYPSPATINEAATEAAQNVGRRLRCIRSDATTAYVATAPSAPTAIMVATATR